MAPSNAPVPESDGHPSPVSGPENSSQLLAPASTNGKHADLTEVYGPPLPPALRRISDDRSLESRNGNSAMSQAASLASEFTKDFVGTENERFNRMGKLLDWQQTLTHVLENPRQLRSPAAYLNDMLNAAKTGETKRVLGRTLNVYDITSFPGLSKLLDDRTELRGQLQALNRIHALVSEYSKKFLAGTDIVLHGPPGSGKTLLSKCLMHGLEEYSRVNDAGKRLRLVFVFDRNSESKFGFGSGIENGSSAHVQTSESGALRIVPVANTHPILLLRNRREPGEEQTPRERFLKALEKANGGPEGVNRSYILRAEPDLLTDSLFQKLVRFYDNDVEEVLKQHIRAEFFELDVKSGQGIVELFPSSERSANAVPFSPETIDTSRLPKAVEALSGVVRTVNPLLSANDGFVFMDDVFLPKPGEHDPSDLSDYTSQLQFGEYGTLPVRNLRADGTSAQEQIRSLRVANANDATVVAKTRNPNWSLVADRLSFVACGHGTVWSDEIELLNETKTQVLKGGRQMAPHTVEALALMSVSSRLIKPQQGEYYSSINPELNELMGSVSAVQKALIMDGPTGSFPLTQVNFARNADKVLSAVEVSNLVRHTPEIADEYAHAVGKTRFGFYDGSFGIAPRSSKHLLEEISLLNPEQSITPFDVVQYFESNGSDSFPHFAQVSALRKELIDSEIVRIVSREGTTIENVPQDKLKHIIAEARGIVLKQYPMSSLEENVEDLRRYVCARIRADVERSLELGTDEQVAYQVEQYVHHVMSLTDPRGRDVPIQYRVARWVENTKYDMDIITQFETNVLGLSPANSERVLARQVKVIDPLVNWKGTDPVVEHICEATPELVDAARRALRRTAHQTTSQFLEDLNQYCDDPGSLAQAHAKGNDPERLERYTKARLTLRGMGYPDDVLKDLMQWALKDRGQEPIGPLPRQLGFGPVTHAKLRRKK